MIGQFFILSPRGDIIINKDFRGDALPNLHEVFFRKVKFWESGEAPPVFLANGITFLFIRRNSLLIACTTKFNISSSSTLEMLNRLAKVFKDYCGILTEESIRKNFTLVYELLDEMLDFGYPQITSTEALKSYIHNEPVVVNVAGLKTNTLLGLNNNKTPNSSNIPIAFSRSGNQKNEIYVDIIERLTILFSPTGNVVNSSIDGSIQMRSFLAGNPELRLALNEDLVIGQGNHYGSVVLDDCNFHECVHLDEFESARTLHFIPPDGEFVLLNYRCTADYRAPFRVLPQIAEIGPHKIELLLTIRADIPATNFGVNVLVQIPMPRSTSNAIVEFVNEIPGCSAEYNNNEKKVVWGIKKFPGGTDLTIKVKITLDQQVSATHKKEIGPISLGFEVPMYNVSNLQVRYLRISETHKSYNPFRWVRYITQSSSYVARV